MMLRDKKAATENRAALRISFADSCSAQGGLSYKIKKRVRCQKVTNSFFEPSKICINAFLYRMQNIRLLYRKAYYNGDIPKQIHVQAALLSVYAHP